MILHISTASLQIPSTHIGVQKDRLHSTHTVPDLLFLSPTHLLYLVKWSQEVSHLCKVQVVGVKVAVQ